MEREPPANQDALALRRQCVRVGVPVERQQRGLRFRAQAKFPETPPCPI